MFEVSLDFRQKLLPTSHRCRVGAATGAVAGANAAHVRKFGCSDVALYMLMIEKPKRGEKRKRGG